MPISVKQLQNADWKLVYHYQYRDGTDYGFKTFSSDIPKLTITHDRKVGTHKTLIYYTVYGRKTDSPSVAVQWWNEYEKADGK